MTHYLFLGDDEQAKNRKITALRQKLLPSGDPRKFDCDVLYADKLSARDLKKSLLELPALADQRLVIIKSAEKLKAFHKDVLLEFYAAQPQTTVTILDAGGSPRDQFFKTLKSYARVELCAAAQGENVFAMTRVMNRRSQADALRVLHELFEQGQHPLQIMGGVIWFWGHKARPGVSRDVFEKGLLYLKEADLNIKRSKLPAPMAMEVLVAKLCLLLG